MQQADLYALSTKKQKQAMRNFEIPINTAHSTSENMVFDLVLCLYLVKHKGPILNPVQL